MQNRALDVEGLEPRPGESVERAHARGDPTPTHPRTPVVAWTSNEVPMADTRQFAAALERARQGERAALSDVLAELRPELLRFVELRLGAELRGRLEPEDLVQQAQLEAARRFGEWCALTGYPFRVWVRLLTAQTLDEARRRNLGAQRRDLRREVALVSASRASTGAVADWLAASQTSASETARRHELRARLEEALSSLEEGDRDILTLRQIEGLSNEEAALELGISPAAASKRLVRALTRLRPFLRGFDPAPG